MRFIPLLSGQTGHSLFFRWTRSVDFGWDKSSRIDANALSYWFAHTAAYSSHPEVLPSRWPLSVTCGRHSIISQHIVPIHFTKRRKSHCAERASLNRLGFTNTGSKVQRGSRLHSFSSTLLHKTANTLLKIDKLWGSELVQALKWLITELWSVHWKWFKKAKWPLKEEE